MATQPLGEQSGRFVSVEEYLSSVYEPDCEFDEGVVVERNLGEFEHAFLQTILATLFTNNFDAWGVFALTEQRIQIEARKFRVPDVCVLPIGGQTDPILTRPPLIVIEILSLEDTMRRVTRKASEYLEFGVEHVWWINPEGREAFRATSAGLERAPEGVLSVPGTPIIVRIAELFAKLDRVRAAATQG
jgi:Uma2 family endonuclease